MEILQFLNKIWQNPITSLLTVLVVTYAISYLFISIFKKYFQRIEIIPSDFSFSKHFNSSIWLIFIFVALKLIIPTLELSKNYLEIVDKIWIVAIISVLTFFLIRIISFSKIIIFNNFEIKAKDEFKFRKLRTQLDFIEKITVVFLCLAGLLAILMNFDGAKKIGTSIMASAGLAGIIIGIAAQRSLGNLIAGCQIAFTQPFKLGDTVVVDGEWGHIKEITLTYIVVKSWDKRNLVVPITYLLEKPFQNWTRSNEKTMGTIYFYVDYSLPVDELRKEFMRFMASSEHWDGETASLYVIDTTEKSMQIRALVSAKNADNAFHLKVYAREHLIKFIQQNYPNCLPKNRVDYPIHNLCD